MESEHFYTIKVIAFNHISMMWLKHTFIAAYSPRSGSPGEPWLCHGTLGAHDLLKVSKRNEGHTFNV